MKKLIEIEDLSYKKLWKQLNLSIEKNKFITISGPNNCGKTTLIRILNREIVQEKGIRINNKNIIDYKIEEYTKLVQCIIPLEIIFIENTLYEELLLYTSDKDKINNILDNLKIETIATKEFKTYTSKEIILSQLAIALIKNPKILLIDNIGIYFEEDEIEIIMDYLRHEQEEQKLTIVWTTINLKESLKTDYLYILNDGVVALEGIPITILEKDNIINKIGLNIPFMIDLSVKLKDYDLIDQMELDMNRMADKLWK